VPGRLEDDGGCFLLTGVDRMPAIAHRPRIRLTIRRQTEIIEQWPKPAT
jgi:hypothetical protein